MTTGTRAPAESVDRLPELAHASTVHSTLPRSNAFCEQLTRTQARNFYYGLRLLPERQRRSMFALYAYMRLVDDIADEDDERDAAQREQDLELWRLLTHQHIEIANESLIGNPLSRNGNSAAAASNGVPGATERWGADLWPAFSEMVRSHRLPVRIFDDVIAGQRQDLLPLAFATFDHLYEYCYQVAGTVGLASIYIWGFEGGEETELLAVERGVAFQLTNILRDLREDASRGRTYLPADELAQAGVTAEQLRLGLGGEKFCRLMKLQIERAERYYEKSRALEDRIDRQSRPTLVAMTEIYRGLLRKIAADPERVLRERVSLSLFSKLSIGWRATRGR